MIGVRLSWRPATTFDDGWRGDEGFRAHVLGDEVGVLAEPVARALDLDDHGVVEQTVEQDSRADGVAEDVAPFQRFLLAPRSRGRRAPGSAGEVRRWRSRSRSRR